MRVVGYAGVTELEPGMQFRKTPGGGLMAFAYVDPAGVWDGRRWVRVTTVGGHQFTYARDKRVELAEDGDA